MRQFWNFTRLLLIQWATYSEHIAVYEDETRISFGWLHPSLWDSSICTFPHKQSNNFHLKLCQAKPRNILRVAEFLAVSHLVLCVVLRQHRSTAMQCPILLPNLWVKILNVKVWKKIRYTDFCNIDQWRPTYRLINHVAEFISIFICTQRWLLMLDVYDIQIAACISRQFITRYDTR